MRMQIESPHDAEGHARKARPSAVIALPRLRGLLGARLGAYLDGSFGARKSRSECEAE